MIGQTISHYKIIEKLGGGGMGVVYKAEDTKLKRYVALKFLPPDLTRDDEAKERFVQEAQTASALDHPNICNIHEIDETEDGRIFICMAYYEGETVKKKVASGTLQVAEAIDIAGQIAQGLAKAHEHGIIHRDIKPANVMITKEGVVKVLDFGLAKLAGQSRLTKTGATVGTVAYMSPEQTRGTEVDHRTDIWALGVVLYEMITGQLPFKGEYEQAVMYSIVNENPTPINSLRAGVPLELVSVANKCLQKDAANRYQHADELLVDLRRLKRESRETPPRILKKEARAFVPVGIILSALILVVIGYFLFFGQKEVSAARIPIAVVDFVNETEEKELNGLSGMLITSLEQSRRLSVLTRSRMFDILKQMDKQEVGRIDETLGREICKQANVNVMVIASIRKLGRRYAIDLKVLNPQKDEYLFTEKEEDEDRESIFSMIDRLAERTRKGLKEKEAEIQAASPKVAEVTTTNFEAYQHYFKGEELINKLKFDEAEEELEKAIVLDTTFALAYCRLAYVMGWLSSDRAKNPIRKAMQYLENAPEKERYLIQALHAYYFEGNDEKGFAIYQNLLTLYPEEKEALFGVGDDFYHKGDYHTAITYLEKVLAIDPTFEQALQHIIWAYRDLEHYDRMLEYAKKYVAKVPSEEAYDLLGDAYNLRADFDQALQTYKRALELFPKSTMPIRGIGGVYIFKNEYQKAEAEFTKLLQEPRSLSDKREGYRSLVRLYAHLGKYREAIKIIDKLIPIDLNLGDKTALAYYYAYKAYWFLDGWNDVENAKQAIEKGLALKHVADFGFYSSLFEVYLMMGEYEKALALAKEQLVFYIPFLDVVVKAYVYRAKGEYNEAIKDFQTVTQQGTLPMKVLRGYDLARCYFETGQNEKAIEAIRRVQRTYGRLRFVVYPKGFYLLGKIYERKGDTKLAIENYEKFLHLWKDADKDLPDLIEAKARLAKLKGVAAKGASEEAAAFARNRVAVLPLANLSPAVEDEYFADGLTEEFISMLSKIGGLRVIARTSVMPYKGKPKSAAEIGRELKVGKILEGSVRKDQDRLRLTVRLIDVETQDLLWSQVYNREIKDIFDIQSDIASQVAHALQVQFMEGESPGFGTAFTKNSEAYGLYLKGRYFWNKRTEAGFKKAIEYFEQALEKDPKYAVAHSGIADCYNLLSRYGILSPGEGSLKAKASALRALELDTTLVEAHTSLAFVKLFYDWEWLGAEQELERAIKLNPSYPSAHHWYSHYFMATGRFEASLAESKSALECDPIDLALNTHLGYHFYYARRYSQAIDQLEKTLALEPSFARAHYYLGLVYVQLGRTDESFIEFQKAINFSRGQTSYKASLGHAYAIFGRRDEALAILEELRKLSEPSYVSAFDIALLYLGLGDKDQAFEWLQKSYLEHEVGILVIKVEPRLDGIRSDPRFTDLLKKVGLEK